MAVFAAFGKITDKGLGTLKEGFRERHEQAVKRAQQRGAKVLASYALMGPYDFLVLLDSLEDYVAQAVFYVLEIYILDDRQVILTVIL